MSRKSRISRIKGKYIILYFIVIAFFIFVIPYICIKLFPALIDETPQAEHNLSIPKTVKVYITEKDRFETIPFETYITGVVAAEMPDSFDTEALKAQSVASRTYALGRIKSGAQLCDTVHCQVFRRDNIPSKVKKAVKATSGQVLLYDGNLASQALYFSSSAGDTENAEDVFSNAYPYLVSVSSDDEPGATHQKEVSTMTITQFSKKIKKAFPELSFGKIKKSNIKICSHTKGGRVATLQVGGQIISGGDFRDALNLFSTRLTITFKGKNITITTSGSGHGVGMSQYGANGMAKEGKGYKEILSHYYQGTTVSP